MKSKTGILIVVFFTAIEAYGQFPGDALRLAQPGYGVSARSMLMGNAMTGLAEGYDATLFNPAGLSQSYQSEVTMGLNFLGYNNDANYLGSSTSLSSSQTDLSRLGIVYPFPTSRGSFVIALGYNRANDFNTALSFKAYNPYSSIIPSLWDGDPNYDIPWNVGLEDTNGLPLITKKVQQSGTVYESGGLNNWLVAGAVDLAPDFSIGLTLNLISGTYHYSRQFSETDPNKYYQNIQFVGQYDAAGFLNFSLSDNVDQDISGWNAKMGFLYRLPDESGKTIARFGGTIEFPSFITVDEKYSDAGVANYISGYLYPSYTTPGGNNNYDITTPFKFAFGVSGELSVLTVAADIQYVDWSEMQFGTSVDPTLPDTSINSLNTQIKQTFRATTSFRVGAELALANPDYASFVPYLRAGLGLYPSPYVGDGSAQAQKVASGGVGFKIQNSISLDIGYQYSWWNWSEQLYYDPISAAGYGTTNKITNTNFMFTFNYDF